MHFVVVEEKGKIERVTQGQSPAVTNFNTSGEFFLSCQDRISADN